MSLQNMDAIQNNSSETDIMQLSKSNGSKPTILNNDSHAIKLVEGLQSLRKDNVLCDIKLKTDDGTIVVGHKNVLISVCPYFRSLFSSFDESSKYEVNIKELDSTLLELLVDYIYTGEILITKENVQVLLPIANTLQLDYVSTVCEDLMVTQLNPSNCLGTKAFADLHKCMELFSKSETYIKKHFLEVTQCNEFLSLSVEEVIKLISCDDLTVPFEDKVFDCVINWVKHDLDCRKDFLLKLMEYVRLPLVSIPCIIKQFSDEPLLKNNPQCNGYMMEALHFHMLSKEQHSNILQTIRTKPRQFVGLQKAILLFNWSDTFPNSCTEWYDPATKLCKKALEINDCRRTAGLGVVRNQFVFAVGGMNNKSSQSVKMLDLFSQKPCWVSMSDMSVGRKDLGVGVLDDCVYAVGGTNGTTTLNSAEVYDFKQWRMISSMSSRRDCFGVGVLNNHLYVIGGWDGSTDLKSVECYDPIANTWTPVADMSVYRQYAGVGVLDNVIYAIGGSNAGSYLKSAEAFRPSDGVWFPIADMHLCRFHPGVFAVEGLLYVIGGSYESTVIDSVVEIYNPKTNTWSMESLTRNGIQTYGGVVIDRSHIS